jgi:hypothetical protein
MLALIRHWVPPFFASHHATLLKGGGSQLLVGTTRNTILAGSMDLSFREVVLGHADEVMFLRGVLALNTVFFVAFLLSNLFSK